MPEIVMIQFRLRLKEQGIRPNTIRLSIGIEKAEDLIAALEEAFKAVKE